MHCDQLQQCIDELLDRREDLSTSAPLQEHLTACPACQRLAAAYDAMLLGVELSGHIEQESLASLRIADRKRISANPGKMFSAGRPYWLVAASIAATLVFIVVSGRLLTRGPQVTEPGNPSEVAVSTAGTVPQRDGLTVLTLERFCHSTGQGLAVLPQAVRRVASLPETEGIVGHIRPFTEPVGATWEVLLRAWPGTASPTAVVPESDTSLIYWRDAKYT
jgi:hypothetical protein